MHRSCWACVISTGLCPSTLSAQFLPVKKGEPSRRRMRVQPGHAQGSLSILSPAERPAQAQCTLDLQLNILREKTAHLPRHYAKYMSVIVEQTRRTSSQAISSWSSARAQSLNSTHQSPGYCVRTMCGPLRASRILRTRTRGQVKLDRRQSAPSSDVSARVHRVGRARSSSVPVANLRGNFSAILMPKFAEKLIRWMAGISTWMFPSVSKGTSRSSCARPSIFTDQAAVRNPEANYAGLDRIVASVVRR